MKNKSLVYKFAIIAIKAAVNTLFNLNIKGKENLPKIKKKSKGFIIVANHIANIDPLIIATAVHRKKEHIVYLTKNTLFDVPVLGYLLEKTGQIPVYRETKDAKKSLTSAKKALRDGKIIIIFPEGTLSKNKDKLPQKFKTGAVRLAKSAKVPIIPLAHWGLQKKNNTKIMIEFSKPIYIKKFHNVKLKTTELQKQITKMVKGLNGN